MTDIFRQHYERMTAAQASASAQPYGAITPLPYGGAHHRAPGHTPGAPVPVASEYRLKLAELGADLDRLRNIQSLERKIAAKRDMIGAYLSWIDGALSAPAPAQDEIVTTMMIWAIDIADWPLALRLARHVLAHGLALPSRYDRTPGCLIAEQVAEAALAPAATGPAVPLSVLLEVEDMTDLEDMPDQARAKLYKAKGLALRAQIDGFDPEADSARAGGKPALIAAATAAFTRALSLDRSCGVKDHLRQLERMAKAMAATTDESAA